MLMIDIFYQELTFCRVEVRCKMESSSTELNKIIVSRASHYD